MLCANVGIAFGIRFDDMLYATGIHNGRWINNDCLKRLNLVFKSVVYKDTYEALKSVLDSSEVRISPLLQTIMIS